jgi:hypothetical protein
MVDESEGYNIATSEMGHLYYTVDPDGLGNLTGGPLSNTGPFYNLQHDHYWSTEHSSLLAWQFGFHDGL